jgi:hypothetical protein
MPISCSAGTLSPSNFTATPIRGSNWCNQSCPRTGSETVCTSVSIARAQPAQPLGHRLQHHIAHFAAQRVGHQLQPAELHVGDGVAAAFLVQLCGQRAGVEQPGGRVVGGVVGQVALVGQPLADVLGQHQAGLATVEIQPRQMRAHLEQGAVLAPVHAYLGVLGIADGGARNRTADLVPAFARTDIQDAHRQELVAAVAVLLHRRLVDLHETQRVRVEHPERGRVAVEQQPELALGLLHAGQRLHAFAHIGQRADHAPLPVRHRHPLSARGHPAHRAAGQHHPEHFIQHAVAGEGIVERQLHALGVLAVHAREERRHRQAFGLDAEDLPGQRRPAQQRGVLVHVPGAHLAHLVRHQQLGMAGAQFLGERILAAGGTAHAHKHQREHAPVQQVQRHRRLHVRPPGRQHVGAAQPGVHRDGVLAQGGERGNPLDVVDGAGFNAQRDHGIAAQHLALAQAEALPGEAHGVRAARQHVALRIGDRDDALVAGVHATDDRLQLTGVQPAQQPAVVAHAQRQRQHPALRIALLRRPQVQPAVAAAIGIHGP